MHRAHRPVASVASSPAEPPSQPGHVGPRRRILLVHNFYASTAPSGEDVVFEEECRLLRSAGHEVIEYVRRNDEFSASSLAQKAAVGVSTLWSLRTYRELRQLIKKCMPDIAHFHNTFPLISASGYAACRSLGVPVVQTLHNYRIACANTLLFRDGMICEECLGRGPWPAVRHKCYRRSAALSSVVATMIAKDQLLATHRLVDRYIAPTRFVAEKIAAAGVPPNKIAIKPHVVQPAPAIRSENDRKGLVFAGRLVPEKGVMTLLRALEHLPAVELDILGDGLQRANLESFARKSKVRVRFRGYVDRPEVLHAIARARALVMPSECYETFGMTVLEAYSCGTPVVAAEIGGLPDLVENGQTGFTFPPADELALKRAIEKVLTKAADQWTKSIRRHFLEHFCPSKALQKIELIYDKLIRGLPIESNTSGEIP